MEAISTPRALHARRSPGAQASAREVMDTVPKVMDALRGAMRRHVGEQLSVPQFRCLNFIAAHPGSSIGAVATFLGVTMPTASALVDRLSRAGAVRATTATADRRRTELQLTDAGRVQLDGIRRGALDELSVALAACSEDDLQTLAAGLAVLRRTFHPL